MKPTTGDLRELLRLVAATEAREIDCEEFLDRAAAYLESLADGRELPPELREVSQHLAICEGCREELDALVELHFST